MRTDRFLTAVLALSLAGPALAGEQPSVKAEPAAAEAAAEPASPLVADEPQKTSDAEAKAEPKVSAKEQAKTPAPKAEPKVPAAEQPPAAKGPQPAAPGPADLPTASQSTRVTPAARQAVSQHALLQRLATVGAPPRFGAGTKGAWRWRKQALGAGSTVPLTLGLPESTLRAYATADGRTLWLTSATVRDPAAVLRLGDLLPLLKEIGISDRDAALAVTQVSVNGTGLPPSYTLTLRTGALWPHRAALARAEQDGRVFYSLSTGKVTVLGALVVNTGGDFVVRPASAEGDSRDTLKGALTPSSCEPLEAALRSPKPASAAGQAAAMLLRPNRGQACAARYLAVTRPAGAAGQLRAAMKKGRIKWPAELIEALVTLDPKPGKANLDAAAALLSRTGSTGADALCRSAPLSWSDGLIERTDVRPAMRELLRRCAMR